ncbi:DinB family protein [Sulfurifustis variabilis]|uniref:DinB family protein n=1 Tax=Sulfurifustis variabilis TaxID=1675686 RepID=A0A1B4V612_9GAMM|nr:DinB family protein [Sulfurifustis variabilis]BAU46664.1 DinB family protein [Sulfurifustis variabilis]
MKAFFVEQADYQRWASAELFRSLDTLTEEQRQADLGLFFRNIHRTVDHILVVTRNWRARLAGDSGKSVPYDVVLFEEWEGLKRATLEEFAGIASWLGKQPPEWFAGQVAYTATNGAHRKAAVADGLTHIMTHAVHHRGQVSAICTRLGVGSPEMDFVFYRQRGAR